MQVGEHTGTLRGGVLLQTEVHADNARRGYWYYDEVPGRTLQRVREFISMVRLISYNSRVIVHTVWLQLAVGY